MPSVFAFFYYKARRNNPGSYFITLPFIFAFKMILIDDFIDSFAAHFPAHHQLQPWELTTMLSDLVIEMAKSLDKDYILTNGVAIHFTAMVEQGAVIKPPAIIGKQCFIGANAYLRDGVYLAHGAKIGTGCEVKTSIIMHNSAIAHFNFIGDSIIGGNVNFEAGAITANHFNERIDKNISVCYNGNTINTAAQKFGSLVGDDCKIGANAVLSPGTILHPKTIVKRLELVDQLANNF